MQSGAVIITGAGRGLGLHLVRAAAAKGLPVIATHRSPRPPATLEDLTTNASGIRTARLDLTDPGSISDLIDDLRRENVRLWAIINNAGANRAPPAPEDSAAELQALFAVNACGPYVLSRACAELLADDGRIVCISSDRASLTQAMDMGSSAYAMSKAALNMAVRKLARGYSDTGRVAVAVHPGWLQTDMGGAHATTPPDVAALDLLDLVERLEPADNGHFLGRNGGRLAW